MGQSERLPSQTRDGGDEELAGRFAHGRSSCVSVQHESSSNFDDFDFDAIGTQFGVGGNVPNAATNGAGFHPEMARSTSTMDDAGLNFLSAVTMTKREMRVEKMRLAKKNRSSRLSLRSEASGESAESAPYERRSFFQIMSDRTPLLVSCWLLFIPNSQPTYPIASIFLLAERTSEECCGVQSNANFGKIKDVRKK